MLLYFDVRSDCSNMMDKFARGDTFVQYKLDNASRISKTQVVVSVVSALRVPLSSSFSLVGGRRVGLLKLLVLEWYQPVAILKHAAIPLTYY